MDLKRILGVALLILAALVTWMASQLYFTEQDPEDSPYWWRGLNYTGQVIHLDSHRIVIRPQGGRDRTFNLTGNTRVMLIGHVTLEPGLWVQVKYLENTARTEMTARGIREVKPPPGTASRAPGTSAAASP